MPSRWRRFFSPDRRARSNIRASETLWDLLHEPVALQARIIQLENSALQRQQQSRQEQEREWKQSHRGKGKRKTVTWGYATIIPDLEPEPKPKHQSKSQAGPANRPKHKGQLKSILKPPTALDKAMAHVNLWELIKQSEAMLRINHDYLDITADEETLDSWYRIEEYTRLSKANGLAKGKSDAELEMKWNWQEDDFSPDGDQDEVEGQCESQDEDRVFEEFWVGVSKGSGE